MAKFLMSVIIIVAPNLVAQSIDWATLFEGATIRNPATNDSVREKMTGEVLPQLFQDDAVVLSGELPGLLVQFKRKDDAIRLQASAVLLVLAQFRPDSAAALGPAVPVLIDHVQDAVPRIRKNSVNTLSSLNPVIPVKVLHLLLKLLDGSDEPLADAAAYGVARMVDSSADASSSLIRILSQKGPTEKKIAVIKGISAARVTDTKTLANLANALEDKDEVVVAATLQAISALGPQAIGLNLRQITGIAEISSDKDDAALARQLVVQFNARN
jgi:hypothetical protein